MAQLPQLVIIMCVLKAEERYFINGSPDGVSNPAVFVGVCTARFMWFFFFLLFFSVSVSRLHSGPHWKRERVSSVFGMKWEEEAGDKDVFQVPFLLARLRVSPQLPCENKIYHRLKWCCAFCCLCQILTPAGWQLSHWEEHFLYSCSEQVKI